MTEPKHANIGNDERLISKAMLNAAKRLNMTNAELSAVVGISESKLSRMNNNEAVIAKTGKEYELALLFIRLYRSLDSITGGDSKTITSWIRNHNTALKEVPSTRIKSLEGLIDVLHYLDSRRAII